MKFSKQILCLMCVVPFMAVAAIVGTFYVKDIINGNGLENTNSIDDPAIRQLATTAIIVQKVPITGRSTSNQYKIIFKDGGSEVCSGVGLLSTACELVPGTLVPPTSISDGGEGGGGGNPLTCATVVTGLTGFYRYYQVTVDGEVADSGSIFIATGVTTEEVCS